MHLEIHVTPRIFRWYLAQIQQPRHKRAWILLALEMLVPRVEATIFLATGNPVKSQIALWLLRRKLRRKYGSGKEDADNRTQRRKNSGKSATS